MLSTSQASGSLGGSISHEHGLTFNQVIKSAGPVSWARTPSTSLDDNLPVSPGGAELLFKEVPNGPLIVSFFPETWAIWVSWGPL